MVVRLAENGCLLSHLKKSRDNAYINVQAKKVVHFTPIDRIKFARDVACGMVHLASKVVNIVCIVIPKALPFFSFFFFFFSINF